MDRLEAAVVALTASLSNYRRAITGISDEDHVEAARTGLRAALDHFARCCEEDTDWGNPLSDDLATGTSDWESSGGHHFALDYRVKVQRPKRLMNRAHEVVEADDACAPMQVDDIPDAVFGLLVNFQQDVVQKFREAGSVAEFRLRAR